MALLQIEPELLNEWKKEGELLIIWKCERCFEKIPFYKSGNELIDSIYLWWAHDHKYCWRCEKKINGIKDKKKEIIPRINSLLEKYEPVEEYYIETFK